MIHHVCMFKLKEENKEETLKKALELAGPLEDLPQAAGGQVVVNDTEADSSNYDLCLLFDFASYADLDAYQNDPVHRKFKEYVVRHMTSRACIDYEK